MSVADKDKLSELIARKLTKQMKWMEGKMVRDGVKSRRGEEQYSYLNNKIHQLQVHKNVLSKLCKFLERIILKGSWHDNKFY